MSLFTTLLWVIVSPATTLVCVCAGMAVLCSVPLAASLPIATAIFAGYCIVCWFGSQRKQKVASLGLTLVMATAVLTLSISFLIFVAKKIQEGTCRNLLIYVQIYVPLFRIQHDRLFQTRQVSSKELKFIETRKLSFFMKRHGLL